MGNKIVSFSIFILVLLAVQTGMGQNIVQNPGFEEGNADSPNSWFQSVVEGSADFIWCSDVVHNGSKSVHISHTDSATSSYYQTISVSPSFEYRVSAYIKTDGVEEGSMWFEGGAQIMITGDVTGYWWDNMTEKISGTKDWTKVTMEFSTKEGAETVEINCNLGAGLKIRGDVWFDDIILEGTEITGSFFRNGGFEDDTLILSKEDPNWNGGWFIEFDEFNSIENGYVTVSLDSTVYHSGKQSLRLYCVPNYHTGWMQLMQNGGPYPEGLIDGEDYKISGWIKTAGDVSSIRMRCGEEGALGSFLSGDNDWTYVEGIRNFDEGFYSAWGFLGLTFYKDNTSNSGTVWYDDINVERVETSIRPDQDIPLSNSCHLLGNYPNPFNPNTTFLFTLERVSEATLTVYNMLGQQVDLLLAPNCQKGENRLDWRAPAELSSGVYFYELTAGNHRQIKKMILMR